MHEQYLRRFGLILAIVAVSHPPDDVSAQERGLPGVSSPGVSAQNNGFEVSGTLVSYGRNEAVVDVGEGKTFRITINGGTMLSVRGRAPRGVLEPGSRVQVTGNLSRDPRVIHDASVTLFSGTAGRNSRSSGAASKRDPSWLQFMGTVVAVSPLVVQADRDTKVHVESLRNGRQTPVGGQSFEIQQRGGENASVSVEFGDAVHLAGDRPNVRSFVGKNGAANYLTITRVETAPPGNGGERAEKAKKRRVQEPPQERKPEPNNPPRKKPANDSAAARFKSSILRQWNAPAGSHVLLALEEHAPSGFHIHFIAGEIDDAAEQLAQFMAAQRASQRRFQLLGRFAPNELGTRLAQAHKDKLEQFIALRLKDSVFDRAPCYSDLDPSSTKSTNQKVAEGTCVIYRPFN